MNPTSHYNIPEWSVIARFEIDGETITYSKNYGGLVLTDLQAVDANGNRLRSFLGVLSVFVDWYDEQTWLNVDDGTPGIPVKVTISIFSVGYAGFLVKMLPTYSNVQSTLDTVVRGNPDDPGLKQHLYRDGHAGLHSAVQP